MILPPRSEEGRDMSELKTWLEAIAGNNFDAWTRATLITETQKIAFTKPLPPDFEFLGGGFVRLSFECLGLPQDEFCRLSLAFVGAGVAVPGTPYRLRNSRPF